jgi:gamma-glutamylcyclotransferase (GGCT)/AIG2-like uncharacterized protein YtfP
MRLLVYGSLRKNGWLHEGWLGLDPIKTVKLVGYDLFAITNAYPAASEGKNTIICELYDIEEDQFHALKRMELNAGYYEKEVMVDNTSASIFLMKPDWLIKSALLIKDGDWIKHYIKLNNE